MSHKNYKSFLIVCLMALSLISCSTEEGRQEKSSKNTAPHKVISPNKPKEMPNIDADLSKKDTKSEDIPAYVQNYTPQAANLTGAYLSARIARFHYDFDAAASHSQRAFALDESNNLFIKDQGVRLSLAEQDFETAAKFAQKILKKENEKVTPIIALVAVIDFLAQDKTEEAAEILEKYGDDIFNAPVKALVGSTLYYMSNNFKEANKYLASLKGYDLFEFLRLYHAALIEIIHKNYDMAELLLAKAQQYRDPMTARIALTRAWVALQKGDMQKANIIIEKAGKKYPDHMVKSTLSEWQKSKILKFSPAQTYKAVLAEAIHNIGVIYGREHDYETSLAFFFMSDFLRPKSLHNIATIAEIYATIKVFDKSADFYKKLAQNSDQAIGRDATLNAVYALNAAKRSEEAYAILKDAITKDPEFPGFHHALGDLLRTDKKYQEAISQYNLALERVTEDKQKLSWRIYYMRGIAYERSGMWEKAEADLLEAMKYVPNNAEVVNYLAYSWIDRGQNLPQALELLERAVKRAPENGYIVDSLGWAYYNIGQYKKAVAILSRALELTPGDPVINEHMADAFWKVGRYREAYFGWYHALQFDPEPKDKQRIAKKYEFGLDQYKMMASNNNDSEIKKEQLLRQVNEFTDDQSFSGSSLENNTDSDGK
ncbi:MAG: tetratricopeptide repeat protein [Pseudomonadota bacterium]